MSKKPRGDSKLKALPEQQQEQLVEFCRSHTFAEAVDFAKKTFAVETSAASLSEFWHWWHLQRRLELAAAASTDLARVLKELPGLDLNTEQLSAAGQAIFEAQAATSGDAKLFLGLKEARQGDAWISIEREKLQLAERKFMFSAAKALLKHADKVRVIVDGPGSDEAKTEQLGQLIFEEAWK